MARAAAPVPAARAASRVRVRASTARCRASASGPYVFRLAEELGLAGSCANDERGVVLEVEGDAGGGRALPRAPAARGAAAGDGRGASRTSRSRVGGERGLRDRRRARAAAPPAALVSPDTATCDACLAELFDPADRRHRYPFINCTNCGPRFTIVRGVPYDRPLTTMAGFAMCAACQAEYDDPRDRRFHAQPNACPDVRAARARWSTRTGPRPTAASDPVARRGRARCAPGGSSRSRASAATTSPAAPTTSRRSPRCGRASTARTGRSR